MARVTLSLCFAILAILSSCWLQVHALLKLERGKGANSCPCSDMSLCEPISTGSRKEVLGFVVNKDNWKDYNWTYITTLAIFTDFSDDLLCYAHSKGVRVVLSGSYPIKEMDSIENRTAWINSQLDKVSTLHADGFNIDIEDPTRNGTNDTELLTEFVTQFVSTFKKANSNYQVSLDVGWSPNCIDGRCYDALALSKVTDFLVIMSYDERSQIYDSCIASANSAVATTTAGLQAYLDLGISAGLLVMGVPWYGYDYPCLNLSAADNVCFIKPVPFRGVYCSDAAGTEIPYSEVMKWLPLSSSGYIWNSTLQSPFFNIKINNTDHQVWFDDPKSLKAKFLVAQSNSLRGIAFWNFDSLDYSGSSTSVMAQTASMWQALDLFFN